MSSTAFISGVCPVPFTGIVNAPDRCSVDTSTAVRLGGNMSSGHITGLCTTINPTGKFYESSKCVGGSIPPVKTVPTPAMVLMASQCPPPTAAQFAKFPKVAVPCSVKTELLRDFACPVVLTPRSRFQRYVRYQPPVPCPPLPETARMVGISQPSTRVCNLPPRL